MVELRFAIRADAPRPAPHSVPGSPPGPPYPGLPFRLRASMIATEAMLTMSATPA